MTSLKIKTVVKILFYFIIVSSLAEAKVSQTFQFIFLQYSYKDCHFSANSYNSTFKILEIQIKILN